MIPMNFFIQKCVVILFASVQNVHVGDQERKRKREEPFLEFFLGFKRQINRDKSSLELTFF